jgi:hypothetical protein
MRLLLIAFLCAICASAQTTLSGNISGITLEQTGNPFIVTDNLTIPEGKSVTIKEGCVFLFKPFTGLIVDGSLKAEGTLQNPVVFTTVNDGKYNQKADQLPNPFDWNGILISAKASQVNLSNFVLEYSVYGIKSMKEEFSINNGTFNQNGQFHLTIKEAIKPVAEGLPYSYGTNRPSTQSDPLSTKRLPLILGTTGAICGIGAVSSTVVFFKERSDYSSETSPSQQQSSRSTMTAALVAGGVLGVATCALVPTAIFVHNRLKSTGKKTVFEIIPHFSNGPILAVRVRF